MTKLNKNFSCAFRERLFGGGDQKDLRGEHVAAHAASGEGGGEPALKSAPDYNMAEEGSECRVFAQVVEQLPGEASFARSAVRPKEWLVLRLPLGRRFLKRRMRRRPRAADRQF